MQAQPSIFKNDKQPEEREAALLLKPYRARSCTIPRNPVLQFDDSTHTDSEMEMLLLTYKLDLCHSLARHFQVIVSMCPLKLLEKTFTSSPFTYNRHKWKRHSSSTEDIETFPSFPSQCEQLARI